jgi:hypothetical protein
MELSEMSDAAMPRPATDLDVVDLLCVHHPRPQKEAAQNIEFESIVSYARARGLSSATVGYPDQGPAAADLVAGLSTLSPRLIYWHLGGRADAGRLIDEPSRHAAGAVEIAGGDFAGRHDRALLERVPDLAAIVRGEPEETVAAVAEALRDGRDWRREPGLTYRGNDAAAHRNPPRPLLEDLDPLAARATDFFTEQRLRSGQRVMISRGCNSDCQYCGLQTPYLAEHGPRFTAFWRARSAEGVLDEIERFHALGVRSFLLNSFVVFGYDDRGSRQLEAIAQGILDRGLELELRFVTLVRDLHRNLELLPLLRRAGLGLVTLGIDSGLPRALRLYRVEQNREQVHDCLAALSSEGIPFISSFIFYDPYLTLSEIRENLTFLDSIGPYYRHMAMPFSYFLDQQLLGTVLRVRHDIPIYGRLVDDGLAERVDPLEREPRIGMQQPAVGRLFQAHQAVNKVLLPMLRPVLFSTDAVERHPVLERLPMEIVERLVDLYEASPETPPQDALTLVARHLHETLAGDWEEMIASLDPDEEQRDGLRRFLDNLAGHADAA